MSDDPDPDQIREALTASLADLAACNVPEADRTVSLGLVLAARLLQTVQLASISPGAASVIRSTGASGTETSIQQPEGDAGASDTLGRIATKLELDRELLESVYVEKDGELSLVLSPRRLVTEKAAATRDIALLVAAGRQAAEIEEWTKMSTIRPVVSDFGRLDGANFAAYINRMDKDGGVVLHGKGVDRQMKLNRVGFGQATDLITRLTSS